MRTGKASSSPAKVAIDQVACKDYALYNGDSCEVLPTIPSNSIGFICFSPPFATLYSYSDSDKDMGNSKSYEEFFEHYDFLVKELYRVSMPGRITAVHCMYMPTYITKEGYIGIKDFPGDLIRAHEKRGFIMHGPPITIWKNPLVSATRTHALGLAHKQIVKDSAMCRVGIPDMIVYFRKPGENPKPIKHPTGLTEYPGERPVPRNLDKYIDSDDPRTNKRSHWIWQQIASPVWMDIDQMNVLPYKKGREEDDQRHICCLQLQVIERCLILWSNEGDIVLSPFMGVGSEVYSAVRMGRRGIGIELKPSYFRQAKRNMESLKNRQKNPPKLDL